MENPAPGERPFKISKPTVEQVKASKGFSILNEQRVKAHVSITFVYFESFIGAEYAEGS